MSDFSAAWLALREAADKAARAGKLTEAAVRACAGKPALTVIDLGAGSGANLRHLAPHLGPAQSWLLVDHDASLLRQATAASTDGLPAHIDCLNCDLADALERIDFARADLVTASALMDLVSADWFEALAARCRNAGTPLLFVLTYDGRIEFEPQDQDDAFVRDLFNRHQQSDKGLGPALGPVANEKMRHCLERLGYSVESATSDWDLGPSDRALQATLLEGYAAAASEVAPDATDRIADWLRRQQAFLNSSATRLRVGHRDLFASL